MDWLRSEDLKEVKDLTAPVVIIAEQRRLILGYTSWNTGQIYELGSLARASSFIANFLKPRLMQSHTTVMIPLHKRIFFVRLLHCSEFSSWLSKISQTLHAISGIQFQLGSGGLGERWPFGSVCLAGAPACDRGGCGALRNLGVSFLIRFMIGLPQSLSPVPLLVN
jgi:hypothetical protein